MTDRQSRNLKTFGWAYLMCLLAGTLVMGAGWGIRGSFGHCRGAMMPGAMLGLVLAACAGRPDWWGRAPTLGLLSGIGWAIGGCSSYGLLVGYTLREGWTASASGYYGLMIVGAFYGGIGCGLLGLGLTKSRSFLEGGLWPMAITYSSWLVLDWSGATHWSLELVGKDPQRPMETHWLYDTVWLYSLITIPVSSLMLIHPKWRGPASVMLCMAIGWWLSMAAIVGATGFRINPSRNDSWAGVLGVLLGLLAYLVWNRNRAAVLLVAYGLAGGAIGFPLGQFFQALGRFKIGPFGSLAFLAELDHWTLMEQVFGYSMGLAATLGVLRLVRHRLAPASSDESRTWMNWASAWALFGPLLVFNASTNLRKWKSLDLVKPVAMNLPVETIAFWIALLWIVLVAWLLLAQRSRAMDLLPPSSMGRAQLMALLLMLAVMCLYVLLPSFRIPTSLMFVLALAIAGLCVIHAAQFSNLYRCNPGRTDAEDPSRAKSESMCSIDHHSAESETWRLSRAWILIAMLALATPVVLGIWTNHLPRHGASQ